MRKNQPSYRRALAMPSVFSSRQFQIANPDVAGTELHTMLSRMRRAGFIADVGPRSGLFYNLAKHPDGIDALRPQALLRLYPSAVVFGAQVLFEAGWITQIPEVIDVAVNPLQRADRLKAVDGFRLHARPVSWFKTAHRHLSKQSNGDGLPRLTPLYALRELVSAGPSGGLWVPGRDDLDVPDRYAPALDDLFSSGAGSSSSDHGVDHAL